MHKTYDPSILCSAKVILKILKGAEFFLSPSLAFVVGLVMTVSHS